MNYWKKYNSMGLNILREPEGARFSENGAYVLSGKNIAKSLRDNVKNIADSLSRQPTLHVTIVGNDPASHVYAETIKKSLSKLSIEVVLHKLNESISSLYLEEHIKSQANDSSVDSILIQLPLPKKFNEREIVNLIPPHKDADGVTTASIGSLASGEFLYPIPCTPFGVMVLLEAYGIGIEGKNCVVMGRSNIVGKPMGYLLLSENGTITTVHSKTINIKEICNTADILVVAIGKKELVTNEYINEKCVVIDVGIHETESGLLCGDVSGECSRKAKALTPVPGGTGPLTIALLAANTILCHKLGEV